MGQAACATCHTPDAIDIASYNFDDADITRRALEHLDATDTRTLVDYIHALRTKLNLYPLKDPDKDRPLQPGGAVLPGQTPTDRDFAFAQELKEKLPRFFDEKIETIAQAKAAEQDLLDLQPVNLKVGIPLNRLSEDVAHGKEHSSIAQWLPEVPPSIPPADLATWYAAEDAYLLDPTDARLQVLIDRHIALVDTSRQPAINSLSAIKFRALLAWQHRLRKHTDASPVNVAEDAKGHQELNTVWNVGEFARVLIGRDALDLGMDPEMRAKKLAGPPITEQEKLLRASWFWAGWLSDQGLFRTSREDKTRYGQWMSTSLSQDGPYPVHNVYANARRQAVISNDVEAWGGEPLSRRRRIWDFSGLRVFRLHARDIPAEPVHRQLYLTFTLNCFRMNLLLLRDDIAKTGIVWWRGTAKEAVRQMVDFIQAYDPADASNALHLRDELYKAADLAKERV
jgi:hypothetical protein